MQFAESVHSLRAIGIAEQRNEGDPDWKEHHRLLKRALQAARRVEQPERDANQQQSKAGIGRNAIAGELRSKQDLVNAKVMTDEIASECDHAQRDDE